MRSVMRDCWVQKTMMPAVIRTANFVATKELCAVTKIPHVAKTASLCQHRWNVVMPSQQLVNRNRGAQVVHQSVHEVYQWQMGHLVWREDSVEGGSVFRTVRLKVCKAVCVTSVSALHHCFCIVWVLSMLEFNDMVQSDKKCIPNLGGKISCLENTWGSRIALQIMLGRYIVKMGGQSSGSVSWSYSISWY